MYGGNKMGHDMPKTCQRDLEGEAKYLKRKIDVNNNFVEALEKFAASEGFYQVEDHSDRKTLFAIYGDLKMRQPGLDGEYGKLLKLIEEKG